MKRRAFAGAPIAGIGRAGGGAAAGGGRRLCSILKHYRFAALYAGLFAAVNCSAGLLRGIVGASLSEELQQSPF